MGRFRRNQGNDGRAPTAKCAKLLAPRALLGDRSSLVSLLVSGTQRHLVADAVGIGTELVVETKRHPRQVRGVELVAVNRDKGNNKDGDEYHCNGHVRNYAISAILPPVAALPLLVKFPPPPPPPPPRRTRFSGPVSRAGPRWVRGVGEYRFARGTSAPLKRSAPGFPSMAGCPCGAVVGGRRRVCRS